MAEYIEREAAKARFDDIPPYIGMTGECVQALLAELPAADVEVVKHGRWVDEYKNQFANHKYICSVCGKRAHSDKWYWELSPYCPNCGAKMEVDNG